MHSDSKPALFHAQTVGLKAIKEQADEDIYDEEQSTCKFL